MPLEKKYLDLVKKALLGVLAEENLQRLSLLYDCVVKTNERINITSLVSPIDVVLKHFLDSLSLFCDPFFSQRISGGKRVCDIGCGGGFPGLPVACARPEVPLTMIDSTEKKVLALGENARLLSLPSVEPVWGRGEELASYGADHREKYDVCLSRAVARLPVLCELCLPFVKQGGFFYAMKGAQAMDEAEESRRAIPALGGKLREIREIRFDLSPSGWDFDDEEQEKIASFCSSARYLVIIEKIKNTPSSYPRKWAQMTKKPL